MDPIKFPEVTNTLASNQPQYRALPVYIQTIHPGTPEQHNQYLCKYELSEPEIAQIVKTKSLHFSQFGTCFHPILPQIESPFYHVVVEYDRIGDNNCRAWVPVTDGSVFEIKAETFDLVIDKICEIFVELKPENLVFIERPKFAIDGTGNIIEL